MEEKTTLYLPTDMHRSLQEISRRTKKPQAQMIREALAIYLADQKPPVPKSIGIIDDPGLNGEDVEDWLQAHWRPDSERRGH